MQGTAYDELNRLSELGKEQTRLRTMDFKKISFSTCYHSPLRRARETAEILTEGIDLNRIPHELFREKDQGDLVGKTMNDAIEMYKTWDEVSEDERLDMRVVPNEESQRELRKRTLTALQYVVDAEEGKTVLIVTHGGFMRALYTYLEKKTFKDMYVFDNCGYMVIEHEEEFRVVKTEALKLKDKSELF